MNAWRIVGAAVAAAVISIGFWILVAEKSTLSPWSVAVLPAAAMGALAAAPVRCWSALFATLLVVGAAAETAIGEWFHLRKDWENRLARAPAPAPLLADAKESQPGEQPALAPREDASYRLAWAHFGAHLGDNRSLIALSFALSLLSALQAARLVLSARTETNSSRAAQ